MSNKPRILVAQPFIIKELNKLRVNVFNTAVLTSIFEDNKDKWRLPLTMDARKFLDAMAEQDFIEHADFVFPGYSNKRLFFFKDASVYDLSVAILPGLYLSHYSALSVYGLTEQIPKTIYVTQEQSDSPGKSRSVELTQAAIDEAFKKAQRQSETFINYKEYKILLLRGKNTKNLGVQRLEREGLDPVKISDIERTLIDIVVRPSYAGGIFEVLKAFRLAKEKYNVSVNKLSGYLSRMNFIYPYHQAIGFYLEVAGNYSSTQVGLFKNKPRNHDFYLTYQMQDMDYSADWKLYYPKGMI